MNHYDQAWQRLVTAARQVRDDRDTAAPHGFATRVAARAMGQRTEGMGALLERFSWRALAAAALLAVGGVATNYAMAPATGMDEAPMDENEVIVVFDIS
jgi:hypothetical protein